MESFESLIQNKINIETSNILKAKVISGICTANGKSYILVDASKKKDYMIYTNEFEQDNIPVKDTYIEIVIINNNLEPYGLASYKKAISSKKNNEVNAFVEKNNTFKGIIKSKTKFGYEIKLHENVSEFNNMKLIYLTKREHNINDIVSVKVKNINNNTIYFQYNTGIVSYTSIFKVGQVVKCKIQAIINMVLSVDIVDNNSKSLLNNDIVSCIIPLTDSVDQISENITNIYKIGDEFDAQIIALSPLRVVLSKMGENDQNVFNLLQNISNGQIISAKILSINTNVILLETIINGNIIKCEMPTSEMAWSVVQRESMKNSVWFIGNTIKVQIINFDMRNGRLQVSYKYNLPNPINMFKSEINTLTNANWKINDIITAKPTFHSSLNNKQFCYLNYNNIDLILHDWLDQTEGVEKINKGESVEVVITSISEEQNGLKILVSYTNTPKRYFQELLNKFEYRGTYKCKVLKISRGEYVLEPIAIINNGIEKKLELNASHLENNYFILKYMDIPSNLRINENDIITCKLVYMDYIKKQLKFSINAYNNDKNTQIASEHKIINTYNIGNQ